MIFGFALVVFGYAVLYWGMHHFISPRYSLWCLLGFSSLFKNMGTPTLATPPGPVQIG